MDETTSYNLNPQIVDNKKKTTTILLIAIVIAAAVGGYFFLNQPKKTEETKTVVEDKKTPTPTPTEKPKIDKKSVKIQVLNGTGTPGQASTAVEALKKAGYSADNIKTGNAEEFDNTTTSVTYKDGFKDVADDIKEALETTFDNIEIESKLLDDKSEFDIVVVTGGKIFEEPTTAPTAKPTLTSSSPTPGSTTATATLTPSPTLSLTPTP